MLKINNQDDCCLYNNVFNYQYGFLSSQFVPALLWMETPLLSNGNHVSTLQPHFRAINSINLADPSDKAAKKKKTNKKQAERNKGGNVRPQNRENKAGQGAQAGVQTCTSTSSLSLHVGRPWDRTTSWASDEEVASLSLLPSLRGTPKNQAQPPEPPGAGQGAGWEFGTDHLLCWSFPRASCASRVSSGFYFYIFAEYRTLLHFFHL